MYDVIVSGAGPSGAMAALFGARAGLKVLLLEKGAQGRSKCCAGGLLNRSLLALQDIQIPEALVECELNGFSFIVEGKHYSVRLGKPFGLMVRRGALDEFLMRCAQNEGAELMDNAKVLKVSEKGDCVELLTTMGALEAKYLIVADGAKGVLANQLFNKRPANSAALGAALEIRTNPAQHGLMQVYLLSYGQKVLRAAPSFPLTGAVFPLRSSAIISVVGKSYPAAAFHRCIQSIKEDIKRTNGTAEAIGKPCFHPLPIVPLRHLRSKRSVVVGDAAGLVNPFSGEGISSALISGKAAAKAVAAAYVSGKASALESYEKEIRRTIIPRLNAARLVGPGLHWAVAVLGHERVLSNFQMQESLATTVADYSSGKVGINKLLIDTISTLPSILLPTNRQVDKCES